MLCMATGSKGSEWKTAISFSSFTHGTKQLGQWAIGSTVFQSNSNFAFFLYRTLVCHVWRFEAMTPREMFVWLLICAIQDDVLTLSDCLTIFKTCMTILKILGGPSSPSSLTTLLELYRASYAVWLRSNRSDHALQPFSVRIPPANLEIIVLSNPAPVQQPRPFSILVHRSSVEHFGNSESAEWFCTWENVDGVPAWGSRLKDHHRLHLYIAKSIGLPWPGTTHLHSSTRAWRKHSSSRHSAIDVLVTFDPLDLWCLGHRCWSDVTCGHLVHDGVMQSCLRFWQCWSNAACEATCFNSVWSNVTFLCSSLVSPCRKKRGTLAVIFAAICPVVAEGWGFTLW